MAGRGGCNRSKWHVLFLARFEWNMLEQKCGHGWLDRDISYLMTSRGSLFGTLIGKFGVKVLEPTGRHGGLNAYVQSSSCCESFQITFLPSI
jgi:hypothetical protein